jgi:ATP-binding cassette, subfamily B, beta-glucan exporter
MSLAHWLSTVRKASHILVFDAGRIVEAGTFDELVAVGGRFASLARTQFIAVGPDVAPAAVG